MHRRHTLLIFSQTFVPDPAAVGQHVADAAIAMARRGHRVIVYASARGYENPGSKYPRRENLHGVEVRRLPLASFGKSSIPLRVVGTFSFMFQCLLAGLFTPRVDGIFFSTSPPLIGVIAVILRILRGTPIAYWAMDLNPDQLIALGKLEPDDWTARFLERINRWILRESSLVIALDRFMAQRLLDRSGLGDRLVILPPWPHEEHIHIPPPDAPNPFRVRHGLDGKFVIMYSGNHSPSNPLTTLLEAAVRLRGDPQIRFLFVGGGSGKREVESFIRDYQLDNVLSLPYQPMAELGQSLSAADVHVIALGNRMVGIVHPCKIYGAMTVGRPILYLGPQPSHIGDILDAHQIGRHVVHGDVDGAVAAIQFFRDAGHDRLREIGAAARSAIAHDLNQRTLRDRLCRQLEVSLRLTDD